MRILASVPTLSASALIVAGGVALAQSPTLPSSGSPAPGRNITATGKTMPPANPRGTGAAANANAAPVKSSVEVEMLKAQKATEERNKAWDSKMRKTMGSICNGC